MQTYASEGCREQAVGESKHVRQVTECQSAELIQKFEELINELNIQHCRNLELKSNCEQLKKRKTPTNERALQMNAAVLQKLPGVSKEYLSVD